MKNNRLVEPCLLQPLPTSSLSRISVPDSERVAAAVVVVGHIQIKPKSSSSLRIDKIEEKIIQTQSCPTTTPTFSKKQNQKKGTKSNGIFDFYNNNNNNNSCSTAATNITLFNHDQDDEKEEKKTLSESPAGALSNKNRITSNINEESSFIIIRKEGIGNCKGSTTRTTNVGGLQRNSSSVRRRIFTPEFKKRVVHAFTSDTDCIGNQRATARRFGVHRRQVQKWIKQRSPPVKGNSSDERIHPNSGLTLLKESSSMANAINSLLSLRDAVRIKGPWSPQGTSASSTSTSSNLTSAINLGLLSNSASGLLHDRNHTSPPLAQTLNESRNTTPIRHHQGHHLDNTHNRSPRISPASIASNSPSNKAHGSNNSLNYSTLTNGHPLNNNNNNSDNESLMSPSEILLDELSYLYPQEDYTLLRNACLKNEITLTKLSSRFNYASSYPSATTPSPNNSSGSNGGLKDDYMTQQTLQLIKQQNEYVQMLQQSGVNLQSVFPGEMTMGASLNLSHLTSTDPHNPNSSKYPTWFHPLAHAAAAAAAMGLPTTTATTTTQNTLHGNGSNINGGGSSRKKTSYHSDSHMFLSPKIPAVNSSKPKTVAAALAATRLSPNIMGINSTNSNSNNSGNIVGNGKSKKPSAPRKRPQRSKPSTITRPPIVMDDDDIEPTSVLEITTQIPSDYGMDLTTGTSSSFKGNEGNTNSKRFQNDTMLSLVNNDNNETDFQQQEEQESPPLTATNNNNGKSNGHNLLSAASLSLENYLRNVLPNKNTNNSSSSNNNNNNNNGRTNNNNNNNKSPSPTSSSESSTAVEPSSVSETDRRKQQVLEAFNFDPEVSGDARSIARKFGLNIRVVLKWLREGPSKSLPALLTKPPNGGLNLSMDNPILSVGDVKYVPFPINGNGGDSKSGSTTSANNNQKKLLPNKRKNTKPNQICDFQNDDLPDDTESSPLDMVVPIKKRRVSNSNGS